MGKFSKAIAGGLGASISIIVMMVIHHYIHGMTPDQEQAIQYVIYTGITSISVYAAPANKE